MNAIYGKRRFSGSCSSETLRPIFQKKSLLLLLLLLLSTQAQNCRQKIGILKKSNMTTASDVYSMVKVLWKETAFPRCKVTDSRWNRKHVSLVSWVTADVLQPSSCIIFIPLDRSATAMYTVSQKGTPTLSIVTWKRITCYCSLFNQKYYSK